ncbi:M28 family peptidase [Actinomadura rupiterrae]|uniref:M28 family peptidase n=1 Tax=Actinomadura rupiterrae TaxID=559627 RepID=UPI0020A2C5A6|nr:M28 family peptidase [Actinomadura rupiterrae]MCP2334988.1 Zn-dependent M28 family amino/carboxypeptidase [Actinomadura rupiterrae]
MRKFAIGAAAALTATALSVPSAHAASASPDLAKLVTVKDIKRHLENLQTIADYNGGNRAAGQAGFTVSTKYVVAQLKKAGYKPTVQNFEFDYFHEKSPAAFGQVAPGTADYKNGTDFSTYQYSGSGDVTAAAAAVDTPAANTDGDSGCQTADFASFPKGAIALIQRGGCDFATKTANAKAAGAVAVVIYQKPTVADSPVGGTLGGPVTIPAIGPTYKLGSELVKLANAGGLKLHIKTDTLNEKRTANNVIAETKYGSGDNVVVVGAHLDSVEAGSGINDNGSGTSTILAIAQNANKLGKKGLKNKIRFAWWGAEEEGLLGSEHYVSSLTAAQKSKIALNLNFDMTASPNGVRGVYNGSDPTAPHGSAAIQKVLNDYYAKRKLPTVPSDFNGRSDYGPFLEAGIPAGGIDTGAEGIKTAEEAKLFGGKAGQPYDACYHSKCDRITNINWNLLDTNADGVAFAVQTFAKSTLPVNGQTLRARTLAKPAPTAPLYRGGLIR